MRAAGGTYRQSVSSDLNRPLCECACQYGVVSISAICSVDGFSHPCRARVGPSASAAEVAGRGFTLAQFVQCGFEPRSELVCWTSTPMVEEEDGRLGIRHVVMNRHDVQAVRAQGFEHRCHLTLQHRD